MPQRILTGDQRFESLIPCPLTTDQMIPFGARDLEEAESAFIGKHQIPCVHALEEQPYEAVASLIRKRKHEALYIHLDLDVLDPDDFMDTPLPVPGGISGTALVQLLRKLILQFPVIGAGIFEDRPSLQENPLLDMIMDILQSISGGRKKSIHIG